VTVYVDEMKRPLGNMVMCHMVADTPGELRAMAARIGLRAGWIQFAGTPKEHFDVSLGKRNLAVKKGAVEITILEMGEFMRKRREEAEA